MPTTFNVIDLGKQIKIDRDEYDWYEAEKAHKLVGKSFGDTDDPLWAQVKSLSGSDDKDSGGAGTDYYDQDNSEANGFHIDGGPEQTFDALAVYDATITYDDGTTAMISAVVFQDTDGQTYLAPEMSENADQSALEAKPIVSIEFDSLLASSSLGLAENRATGDFKAPCFAPGVRISVPHGLVPVERLRVGDLVLTSDHGAQPVRWRRQFVVSATGRQAPVRVQEGALGGGLPWRDLIVSPQHRMLVRSKIAARMTGGAEVLVPAKRLVGVPGITRVTQSPVQRYIHFQLDRHEVVFAEGAPTESLLPGPMVQTLLPLTAPQMLCTADGAPARPIPKGHVIRQLIARHRANAKPLLHRAVP